MTPAHAAARIRIITVHTAVSRPAAACFNFHYSGSDERRVVVSMGHRTSSFVPSKSNTVFQGSVSFAAFLKLFVRCHQSSQGLFAASHFTAFPHDASASGTSVAVRVCL